MTPPQWLQRLLDRWDDWRARHRRVDQVALQRSIRRHPSGRSR